MQRAWSDLSSAIEVSHDANQLLGVGRCQSTPLLQNELQLTVGKVTNMQLQESATEGSRQHLAPAILTCRQAKSEPKNKEKVREESMQSGIKAGAFVRRSSPTC